MTYKPFFDFSDDLERLANMTFEEAQDEEEKWREHGRNGSSPVTCWYIWNKKLPKLHQEWIANQKEDSRPLFEALYYCGQNSIPLPPWCAKAIRQAVLAMDNFQLRSWAEVFPVPLNEKNLPQLERRRKIENLAVWAVLEKVEEGAAVTTKAIPEVASAYAVSPEILRDWYYAYLRTYPVTRVLTKTGWEEMPTNPKKR